MRWITNNNNNLNEEKRWIDLAHFFLSVHRHTSTTDDVFVKTSIESRDTDDDVLSEYDDDDDASLERAS